MLLPCQPLSLRARALGYLSRCEHSRVELRRKSVPHAESAEEASTPPDWLEGENQLSNTRFTENMVHRHTGRYDTARLMQELKTYQLGEETLGEVKAQLQSTKAVWTRALWERRFGHPPADPAERTKQVRYMMAHGFSRSVVSHIIVGVDELLEDGDISD